MSKRSQDQYTRCNVFEIEKISTMYVYKWLQDLMYKNNVSKKERKEKIHNILTTSLIDTPPISCTNPPPMSMTTLISKLLHLFVTSDKG